MLNLRTILNTLIILSRYASYKRHSKTVSKRVVYETESRLFDAPLKGVFETEFIIPYVSRELILIIRLM